MLVAQFSHCNCVNDLAELAFVERRQATSGNNMLQAAIRNTKYIVGI